MFVGPGPGGPRRALLRPRRHVVALSLRTRRAVRSRVQPVSRKVHGAAAGGAREGRSCACGLRTKGRGSTGRGGGRAGGESERGGEDRSPTRSRRGRSGDAPRVPKDNSARGMKYTPPEEGEDQEEPSPEGPVESVPTIREDVSGDVPVLSVRVSECVSEAREFASVATGGERVASVSAGGDRESAGLEVEAVPTHARDLRIDAGRRWKAESTARGVGSVRGRGRGGVDEAAHTGLAREGPCSILAASVPWLLQAEARARGVGRAG